MFASPPPGAPPPARPAAAPAPSALSVAQQQAQQSVAATILAIHQQQNADNAAAAQQAAQINAASRAAAGLLQPLGAQTNQDYTDAVNQTGALAQGFTGQLRTDAQGQADAAAATLGHLGAPPHVVSQGDSLANYLYGTGGYLPGEALRNEGFAATANANTLPATMLASGRNDALGVIAAGRDQAAGLAPQLATARGSLPTLTHTYLNDLINQQAKLGPKIYSTGGGIYAVDPQTGQIATLKAPTGSSATFRPSINTAASQSTGVLTYVGQDGQLHSFNDAKGNPIPYVASGSGGSSTPVLRGSPSGGYYQYNAKTGGWDIAIAPTASATKPQIIGSASSGYYQIIPGQKPQLVIPPVVSATATKPSVSIQGDSTTGKYKVTTYPDGSTTVQQLPGPLGKPHPGSGGGGTSATGINTAVGNVTSLIQSGAKGIGGTVVAAPTGADPSQEIKDAAGNPTGFVVSPQAGVTPYPTMRAVALAQIPVGVKPKAWEQRVQVLLDANYPPGQNGRYWQGAVAQSHALTGARVALKNGVTKAQAVQGLVFNLIPPRIARATVNRVYGNAAKKAAADYYRTHTPAHPSQPLTARVKPTGSLGVQAVG